MNRPLGSKGTPRPARLRPVLLRRKGARPPALRGFEIRAARPQSLRALRFHPAHKSLSHVRATRRRARRARARASPVAAPHARADSPRRLPRAPRHLRARARASATAAAPLSTAAGHRAALSASSQMVRRAHARSKAAGAHATSPARGSLWRCGDGQPAARYRPRRRAARARVRPAHGTRVALRPRRLRGPPHRCRPAPSSFSPPAFVEATQLQLAAAGERAPISTSTPPFDTKPGAL